MRLGSDIGDDGELLWLVHHHPGRLRVRAEPFFGDGQVAERVRAALIEEPGILQVSHNPRTGSLLIEYTPGAQDVESTLLLVKEAAGLHGIMDTTVGRSGSFSPGEWLKQETRRFNRFTRELTGGRVGLEELVPAALLITAVYSLFKNPRGHRLPHWDGALHWAYGIFVDWHHGPRST